MKILIVSQYIHPEVGGGPTRITNLALGLRELGHDVNVLTCLPNYPKGQIFDGYRNRLSMKEEWMGITLFRYWTYATVSRSPIKRVLSMTSYAIIMWMFSFKSKIIKSYDRVIIQSPTLFVATSAMVMFKCVFHKTTLLNISDLWPISAVDLGAIREGGMAFRLMAKCEKFLYRKADGIMGQSKEIISYINTFPSSPYKFLYRHLQKTNMSNSAKHRNDILKIVYAGVLNAGQDMLSLVKNVRFDLLNVEFHIYGGGTQQQEIISYIESNPDCNVYYYGFVPKEVISQELSKYDASLIPLAVRIRGAVPSKIYDVLPVGMPVLFCGGGEGADVIKQYQVGYVSEPGNFAQLELNIKELNSLSEDQYETLSRRCLAVAKEELDFDKQLKNFISFMTNIPTV